MYASYPCLLHYYSIEKSLHNVLVMSLFAGLFVVATKCLFTIKALLYTHLSVLYPQTFDHTFVNTILTLLTLSCVSNRGYALCGIFRTTRKPTMLYHTIVVYVIVARP